MDFRRLDVAGGRRLWGAPAPRDAQSREAAEIRAAVDPPGGIFRLDTLDVVKLSCLCLYGSFSLWSHEMGENFGSVISFQLCRFFSFKCLQEMISRISFYLFLEDYKITYTIKLHSKVIHAM